jgi:hypothetical protein
MEKALACDRARLNLPEEMLTRARAGAHAWIGEALLNDGDSGAFGHLRKSLSLRPRQPRVARLAIAAALPRPVASIARSLWRQFRSSAAVSPSHHRRPAITRPPESVTDASVRRPPGGSGGK